MTTSYQAKSAITTITSLFSLINRLRYTLSRYPLALFGLLIILVFFGYRIRPSIDLPSNESFYPSPFNLPDYAAVSLRYVKVCDKFDYCHSLAAGIHSIKEIKRKYNSTESLYGIHWIHVPMGAHLHLLDEQHELVRILASGNHECLQSNGRSVCEEPATYFAVHENLLYLLDDLKKCIHDEQPCSYPVIEIQPSINTHKKLLEKYIQEMPHPLIKYDPLANEVQSGHGNGHYLIENQKILQQQRETEEADATLDVTLVSQFSVNRLDRFEDAIRAWSGPIAATIYLMESKDLDILIDYFQIYAHQELYYQVELAIVLPDTGERDRYRYPINQLRNIATRLVRTSHHLMIDADFVPNHALYHDVIRKQLYSVWQQGMAQDNATYSVSNLLQASEWSHIALVVPCVAIVESYTGRYPETLEQLQELFHAEQAYITDVNAGHGPTLTEVFLRKAWIASSTAPWYEVCYESQWEPYYILPRTAPAWDERFRNQGGDKQQHALLLNALNYRFLVLRDVYLYHRDHARLTWPGGGLAREDTQPVFNYFDGWSSEMISQFGWSVKWPRGCAQAMVMEQFRPLEGIGLG
ncbi:glycosyl-transferase for dystroglycan-domain-containing protein [Syncephalis fuscata]|nr:glycosyl-transferase for dystroglycan-domain-containing protein [Syncephalis fuscata]